MIKLFLLAFLSSSSLNIFAFSKQEINQYEIEKAIDKISYSETNKLGEAKFDAIGNPGLLTISGEKGDITGKYQKTGSKVSGSFDIILNSFMTGMDLRDKHMREKYLETGKYPKATLTIEGVELPKQGDFKFGGKLALHGKTNQVNGDCTLSDTTKLECKFKILLSDYAIAIPEWKGVTIAKDVSIFVSINLK